ncbi:MAG: hypothetical protein WC030_02070 [Candidatus Paceibacterota bacterium]
MTQNNPQKETIIKCVGVVLLVLALVVGAAYLASRAMGVSLLDGVASVAAVFSEPSAEERAKKPVPVLTSEQRYIFEMLGLDAKQIIPYTKFGPITSRFTPDFPNQPLETFFYQSDARGTLSPIGQKRTYNVNGYVSTSWTQIKGRGEIARMWNKYVDATGILVRNDLGYAMLRSSLVKDSISVYTPSTTLFDDPEVIIAVLHGIQAVREGDATTPTVRKAIIDAQKADKEAQMFCSDHVYLLENLTGSQRGDTRSIEFDLVSTIGGDYAFPKYGFSGIQRLRRYHVSNMGTVASVTTEPTNGASYSIKDWDNCEFKQR